MPSGELQGGMQTIQRPCAGGQAVLKRVKVVVEYGGEPFSRTKWVTGEASASPSRQGMVWAAPAASPSLLGTSPVFYDMILSQFYFPRLYRFGRLYFLISFGTRVDRSMPRVAAISLRIGPPEDAGPILRPQPPPKCSAGWSPPVPAPGAYAGSHWAVISSGRSSSSRVSLLPVPGPLDDVVQLPDIAWPAVGQKGLLEGLA